LIYRPDIDGLRALAIILVVLFHAFPGLLPGGFVGVDIFFVISGYLITGIIIEAQVRESFRLTDFYSRRIKRVFPALILVMACCLLAGRWVLMPEEYQRLGQHALAGAAYASNFLLLTEAGYFDFSSESKPFLHLWSLSIEEQFYLAWPLALMLASRQKFDTKKLTLLLLLASFSLNVAMVERWPTITFYSPASRAWELLVGAFLAHLHLQKKAWVTKSPDLVALTGVALIAWALVESHAGMQLPGWRALFPAIGAACLIASGNEAWINRRILAAKLPVFIGLISYPLYLWHWPLLSFARIVEERPVSEEVRVAIIVLSLALAWGTYRFIEKPVRDGRTLKLIAGLGAALAFTGFAGFQIHSHSGVPESDPAKWGKKWAPTRECQKAFGEEFWDFCSIYDSNKRPTVVLLGDSNANHFFPGLSLAYAKDGDNLLNLGHGLCPPLLDINVTAGNGKMPCSAVAEKAIAHAVNDPSIRTVVLSMMGEGYAEGRRSATPTNPGFIQISSITDPALSTNLAVLEHSMRMTLARLSAANKRIVLLISAPMLDFDPRTCVASRPWRITPLQLKAPCAMPQSEVKARGESFSLIVNKVARDFPKVTVVDSAQELCDGYSCWALRDGKLLYRDAGHLSVDGSMYLAERLMPKFQ
jgi:peptidoglycan/LPS O-acetylase OafA/YrhL